MPNINFGQIFGSPIALGVLGFIVLCIFVCCGYMIYSWFKGGRGKFEKSQDRYQKCLCVTANFKLSYFNLKVLGGYVYNEITHTWHILDPEALIPNLDTGTYYLPIDERDAIPLFPLKPELREAKEKELQDNIDDMALNSGMETIDRLQIERKKEGEAGQRKFALAAAFGILALIVLGVIFKQFM